MVLFRLSLSIDGDWKIWRLRNSEFLIFPDIATGPRLALARMNLSRRALDRVYSDLLLPPLALCCIPSCACR